MFSLKIVGSDAFLDMPFSTRELYFQLGMYADDDGFVSPRKIMRMTGASDDDLKILLTKHFLIPFESGVVVVKHWKMNNELKKDRYTPSQYHEERSTLYLKENGAYTLDPSQGAPLCLQNGSKLDTQVSIGKDSIDKNIQGDKVPCGEFKNVFLTPDEKRKLVARYGRSATIQTVEELSTYMKSKGKAYRDHYATLLNWAKRKGVVEQQKSTEPVPDLTITPEQAAEASKKVQAISQSLAERKSFKV